MTLTEADLEQLAERGISREEAERQLALLHDPPSPPHLDRPCTAGDGITRLEPDDHDRLVARYREARAAGWAGKFVPASGAASRMFKTLLPWVEYAGRPEELGREVERRRESGDTAAGDPLRFVAELHGFPFAGELASELAARGQDLEDLRLRGDAGALLQALLAPDRLGYDGLPKALIPFHRYGPPEAEDVRTAFEEQLVEGAAFLADGEGRVRIHCTVPPDDRERIARHLASARTRFEGRLRARFQVSFSIQSPSTDTLALTLDGPPETGEPFRRADGRLLLRPGGHGALLGNLDAVARDGGDLVFVKNIDNVQPDRVKPEVTRWKEILGGYLLELRDRSAELLRRLEAGDAAAAEEATRFLAERLGFRPPSTWETLSAGERSRRLAERLERPLRVGGMVLNRGEPGGGPFWVAGDDGAASAQIVERSQIDEDAPEQVRIFGSSTHFNPVDLACTVRDLRGEPYDLSRYVDERAIFIAEKSHEGRPLLALERPGLWNGAMAGWSSAFVEVPEVTFSPVKTVFDLLRPEHQAG